jgi:hypothetical protein
MGEKKERIGIEEEEEKEPHQWIFVERHARSPWSSHTKLSIKSFHNNLPDADVYNLEVCAHSLICVQLLRIPTSAI